MESVTIRAGKHLNDRTEAVREHYDFTGWYKDESLTEAVDLKDFVVLEDTTLYAGWALRSLHTVTLYVEGDKYQEFTVYDRETLSVPEFPKKDGCVFYGWFKEPSLYDKMQHAIQYVTEDISLYGRWMDERTPKYYRRSQMFKTSDGKLP